MDKSIYLLLIAVLMAGCGATRTWYGGSACDAIVHERTKVTFVKSPHNKSDGHRGLNSTVRSDDTFEHEMKMAELDLAADAECEGYAEAIEARGDQ